MTLVLLLQIAFTVRTVILHVMDEMHNEYGTGLEPQSLQNQESDLAFS